MGRPFLEYDNYAFVFAHPDDEIYSAVTMHRLVEAGKEVSAVYLTNGDYAGDDVGIERERELDASMSVIGIGPENLHKIGVSERVLFDNADTVIGAVSEIIENRKPQCVVGHDYEGGHNGHDLASLCAFLGARSIGAEFWTFPAYHGLPASRQWNRFIDGRDTDYEHVLQEDEKELKRAVVEAHVTQAEFMKRITTSSSAEQFLLREVLRFAGGTIDFGSSPTNPIGYEEPGKTERFDAMQMVVDRHWNK